MPRWLNGLALVATLLWSAAALAQDVALGGYVKGFVFQPVTEPYHLDRAGSRLQLAASGGEFFLVPNMFLVRSSNALGSDESRDARGAAFDAWLQYELDQVESELGVTIYRLDLREVSRQFYEDPSSYGLSNLRDPACVLCRGGVPLADATGVDNADEFVYWDRLHFTAGIHAIFGNAAADLVGAP